MRFGKLLFLKLCHKLYYEIRNFKIKIVLKQPMAKPCAEMGVISNTEGLV
jgi:hypothetical protein